MKDSFINLVCSELDKLTESCGEELRGHTLVFPGRRAILFFQKAWLERKGKATWVPECITIQELFTSLDRNKYVLADDLALCVELFNLIKDSKEYSGLMGTALKSEFDLFYPWGNTIISDFDDLDKNCVDAKIVFGNMQNLAEIEIDYLEEEQKKMLEEYFNFSFESKQDMLEHFVMLCSQLYNIYLDFKASLKKKGWAYEGMRSREIVEAGELNLDPEMHYSFIGFNVLNKVDRILFKKIGKQRTHFYWDYDYLYSMSDEERERLMKKTGNLLVAFEAGKHIRQNMFVYKYESAIEDKDKTLFNNFKNIKKKVKFISTSTNTAQAKYLTQYIKDLYSSDLSDEEKHDTAVVLCDENLLLPVLHSLPLKVGEDDFAVNVTMGYPLSITPAGSLLKAMVQYQNYLTTYGSDTVPLKMILPLLRHPYISAGHKEALNQALVWQREKKFYLRMSEIMAFKHEDKALFDPLLSPVGKDFSAYLDWIVLELKYLSSVKSLTYGALLKESLYRAYTLVVRLRTTLSSLKGVSISAEMIGRLLTQLVSSTTIPFHGEVDKGLQVMGFLETRGLDFTNVVLMSAGEGVLPPKANITSFIPQSIRKAHELTTLENQSSIYAYYFYRLIQRAKNVTILYNGTPSLSSTGQMSRFMMQLMIDTDLEIEEQNVETSIPSIESSLIEVEKDEMVMKELARYSDASEEKFLSPSALNSYLDCQLKFYFQQIMKIRPKQEQEDFQNTDIGTIFHGSMEDIYSGQKNCEITEDFIKSLIKNDKKLSEIVNNRINEEFFRNKHVPESDYSGRMQIHKEMIVIYVKKQLARDLRHCPFHYIESEGRHIMQLELSDGTRIRLGGLIDRVDTKDGCLRVVDYKTGGSPEKVSDFSSMLDSSLPHEKRAHYALQTAIYSLILHKEKACAVIPSLSYVAKLKMNMDDDDQGTIPFGNDKRQLEISSLNANEFQDELASAIDSIFDTSIPFRQTPCVENCSFCDFKNICRRA